MVGVFLEYTLDMISKIQKLITVLVRAGAGLISRYLELIFHDLSKDKHIGLFSIMTFYASIHFQFLG